MEQHIHAIVSAELLNTGLDGGEHSLLPLPPFRMDGVRLTLLTFRLCHHDP